MDAFILKLKRLLRSEYNNKNKSRNKEISKDETETELSESKTILEEKERCIKEILSAKFYMEDLVDKIIGRSKAIHEYQHDLLLRTDNLIFWYVLQPRRRKYFLEHPERNIKDILEAFDGDKVFKWTEECRKEMPIDYNFILSKGTLSDFEGSKGCVGELTVVDRDSEDYDVINFKAEPILNSRPDDDGKDEVYLHARWFKLTMLKYEFLVSLTLASVDTLCLILGFEVGMRDREDGYCLNVLKYLCKINEDPSYPMPVSYEEWTSAWHEELTVSEYRTAVKQLGCSNFKSDLDCLSKTAFNVMKITLKWAMMYELAQIDGLVFLDKLYNKYKKVVKKGRGQTEGLFTIGPLILRYSKTKNRTE